MLLTARERPDVAVVGARRPGGRRPARRAEVDAAVAAALDNVDRHAGPGAQAWVLLEGDSDGIEVTIRDDGAGAELADLLGAAERGRMGVSASIRGRVEDLGGTVDLDDPARWWLRGADDGAAYRRAPADRAQPGPVDAPRTSASPTSTTRPAPRSTDDRPPRPDGARRRRPPAVALGARARPGRQRADRRGHGQRRAGHGATHPGHPPRRARARPQPARDARRRGLPGHRRPADPGAHPLGERRAARRAGGDQGRGHRLPREVGLGQRDRRRRARHGPRRGGVHARAGRAGARRVPPDGERARARPGGGVGAAPPADPRAHRPRDRGAAAGGHRACPTRRSPASCSCRTAPCRTTCRTPSGKLHLHNRVELVRFALAHGLEDDDRGHRTRPDGGRGRADGIPACGPRRGPDRAGPILDPREHDHRSRPPPAARRRCRPACRPAAGLARPRRPRRGRGDARELPPAGLRRRVRRAARPDGRGGPRRGVRAPGRRLRRDLRLGDGRQHPRPGQDDPADGGRAHLRRLGAGGQGRPDGRAVRQAALEQRRDPRGRDAAGLPRRHGQRLRVHPRVAHPRPPAPRAAPTTRAAPR